jgi:integrase
MTEKLTKRAIDGFTFNPTVPGKDIRWDADISGLGVRLYPSGKKSFVLSYRQNGTKRLYTVGQYGQVTLEQARDLAKKRLGEVADGKDPVITRRDSRKKNEWTIKKAFDDFLKRYAKAHNIHWQETQRIFERDILPAIGTKPIDEVAKEDILKIIDKIVSRGSGTMANRTLAALRKFFNWAIERDLIKYSPAFRISPPAKNISRDRVLADDELRDIWQACKAIGYPFGPMVQFLILTGQRRGETANMCWDHLDLREAIWTIPKENTKTKREHIIPLPGLARDILEDCPNLGDYVFTSAGDRPFENMSRGKRELDFQIAAQRTEKNARTPEEWRLHDLRRTAASGIARLGVAPHVIEKVLNHSSGIISGVAAVYNRHHYTKEIGEALALWEFHLREILAPDDKKEALKKGLRSGS